ncbi:MAG: MauE/DoxX family redox-associated membrane protein, partial [Acidimicrobiales bacterium]
MDAALLADRLVLVTVFTVSGLAKLADRPGTTRALTGFGVPSAAAAAAATLLPLAELATAAGLV